MTEQNPPVQTTPPGKASRWIPALKSRWWTVLLGLSLMLNLLVGGMVAGRIAVEGRPERLMGASYVQLVPRRFFHDLSRQRRGELMEIVRQNRPDLRGLREANEATSLRLAEALSAAAYDEAAVAKVIADFSTGSESLAARGGAVALEIVRRLTPEERLLLADAIRERAKGRDKHQ
jgi:uncharacterized membrane protein